MKKKVCYAVSLLLAVVTVLFAVLGISANKKYNEYKKLDIYYEDIDMQYFDNSGYDSLNDLRKDDSYYSDLYNKSHQYLYLKNKYENKYKVMLMISVVSAFFTFVIFVLGKRNLNDELKEQTNTEI